LVKNKTVSGGEIINHSYTNSSSNKNSRLKLKDYIETSDGIIPTMTTRPDCWGYVDPSPLRIRKLTPRECFRLMGLNDTQIDRLFKSGNSNAQLYKQAGNSIVVQVLENIFKEMIK